MRRGLRAPLWFHAGLLLVWAAVCHLGGLHELEASPVTLAFFGWIVTLAEIVWTGIQAASTAVVAYLSWAVNALFWLGQVAYNALVELADISLRGVRAGWRFFRWTYSEILAPAWRKFWHLIDVVHTTLERVFGPVLRILRRIRDEFLTIYTHWVRPILDTIGITRQMLRVLAALHLNFARTLDRKLGDLEAAIDRPFRYVLGKINEVINLVNRIVTLDGLIQRLALVRSFQRDLLYLHRVWINARSTPLTDTDRRALAEQNTPWTPEQVRDRFIEYSRSGGGPWAETVTPAIAATLATRPDVP